jgi:RNA polymerase sigma factor (sigma-70 family)
MRQADTDVRSQPRDDPDNHTPDAPTEHASRTKPQAGRTQDRVGELLGEWQRTELRIARGFAECRGLTTEQLEDIYQDTAVALLARPYATEEHLRNALRHGIKHRALNMHRDTRRRSQILAQSAPSIHRIAEGTASDARPEDTALLDEDRLIVNDFLNELDELEQRIFWLQAEGMRYRAIASALEIPVNQARNASRSCERKRQRFQLLYDTGRLCGYRGATIEAMQAGEVTSDELAQRAFAHLDACARCRAEHKTNAKRLRRTFRGELAALLPLPAILAPAGRLRQFAVRTAAQAAGGVREALVGAAGVGGKVTAGVATLALAGGTIGVTRALQHNGHATPPQFAAGPATTKTEPFPNVAPVPARRATTRHVPRATTRHRPEAPDIARTAGYAVSQSFHPSPVSAIREFGPEEARDGPGTSEAGGDIIRSAAERDFGLPAGG